MNLVIGVGNPDRGDDGVGLVVARLLKSHMPVIEHDGEATALVDTLRSARHTWLIDAAQSDSPPGTIHRIDCTKDIPLLRSTVSSHGFGLAEAIGLARALGTMPPHCIIYAIEGTCFTLGTTNVTACHRGGTRGRPAYFGRSSAGPFKPSSLTRL